MPGVPGVGSPPLLCPVAAVSLLWTVLWVSLVPDHVSTLPALFDAASSLHVAVESVLPVFRLFSGLFILMWVLPRYILGKR